jgi:HEAT repeat protein
MVLAAGLGCCALAGCDVSGDPPANVQTAAREYLVKTAQQGASPSDNPRIEPVRPAVVATSPLITSNEQRSVAETASNALARIGAAAVPQVLPMLQNPDPQLQIRGAEILARIGPDAQLAVPDLTTLLAANDPAVRKAAAHALGQIGPAAAPAVDELIRTVAERP